MAKQMGSAFLENCKALASEDEDVEEDTENLEENNEKKETCPTCEKIRKLLLE